MTRFLHAWWPVAAVVAFTAMLVLQIPRRALFFSPRSVKSPEPFVSIVALDDDAYSALVRRMRMSWQMRGRTFSAGIADSRADAFDFAEASPPPAYLRLEAPREAPFPSPSMPISSLMPKSMGEAMPPIPAASADDLIDRDPSMVAIPDGVVADPPQTDFKLNRQRNDK